MKLLTVFSCVIALILISLVVLVIGTRKSQSFRDRISEVPFLVNTAQRLNGLFLMLFLFFNIFLSFSFWFFLPHSSFSTFFQSLFFGQIIQTFLSSSLLFILLGIS